MNCFATKKKHELQALFDEPFCGVHIVPPTPTEDTALSKEKAKVEELSAKLQTLSIRNVNKKARCQVGTIPSSSQGNGKRIKSSR